MLKRNGPGDGMCPLCGTLEDSNHIFFSCVSAQFLWSCLSESVSGRWCNTNFPDLFAEVQASPQSSRHIRWLAIGVLAWTLWMVHNKLVIQRVPLRARLMLFLKCVVTCSFGGRLAAPRITTPSTPSLLIYMRWLFAWRRRFLHHHWSRINIFVCGPSSFFYFRAC